MHRLYCLKIEREGRELIGSIEMPEQIVNEPIP
jgi:hypothetical protein